jgi:hypothetical protein
LDFAVSFFLSVFLIKITIKTLFDDCDAHIGQYLVLEEFNDVSEATAPKESMTFFLFPCHFL